MRSYRTIEPVSRTARELFFLLAIAVALGLGLAFASPALGAGLSSASQQSSSGTISGTVTVLGGSPAGITVELRQRTNGGDDKVLATATTDDSGSYSFVSQASAPSDAFYYIKFSGGKNTLTNWYSFPIIYLAGSNFTVPSVEMSDVQLAPLSGPVVSLPTTLQWKARRSGETYRVFIYAKGDTSKAALDSGSLGMGTEFTIPQGALPDGSYQATVQVRDAVVGYGQSQAQFVFTVGKASGSGQDGSQAPDSGLGTGGSAPAPQSPSSPGDQPSPTAVAAPEQPAATIAAPTVVTPSQPQSQPPASSPSLQLSLSADHSQVEQGGSMTYRIEVSNSGSDTVPGVVVTDNLPAGVTVDSSTTQSSTGSVAVQGNSVTAQLGDLPANSKVVVEIPVSVNNNAGNNVSNQASAQYQGAPSQVDSNAFIAQVAAPLAGAPASPPQTQPQSPPQTAPQQPSASQPQAPSQSQPQAPASNPQGSQPAQQPASPPASQPQSPPKVQEANPPASQPKSPAQSPAKKPASSIPQTGGSFPLVLALGILLVILLARYLRGRSYRRV